MSLVKYRSKRNFSATSEPKGKKAAAPGAIKLKGKDHADHANSRQVLFVIQKHAATRLHYDFRLELDGVLKSWAVPKGVPTTKGERRLAVEVEDHPVEYANFEGIIAAGNYGAGTVMLWDAGLADIANAPAALKEGKLVLSLVGKKLNGQWTLVRMHPRTPKEKVPWLLIKTESDMKSLSSREEDRSVQSGRSMKQIALAADKTWQSDGSKAKASTTKGQRVPAKRAAGRPRARD